jgi:hypothetical protein
MNLSKTKGKQQQKTQITKLHSPNS